MPARADVKPPEFPDRPLPQAARVTITRPSASTRTMGDALPFLHDAVL